MLELMHLLEYQTAFLVMKMKESKGVIKCSYHWNGFKSLPWKEGKIRNRAPPASAISTNRSKRQTELTGSWSRSRRGVWSDRRDGVILSQREQWFRTQFFIKIIVSGSLRV